MLNQIENILRRIEKPGRYVGGEMNSADKDWDSVEARIVLAFPDVYDLGMSYHGFRILYERLNKKKEFLADRSYTPWPDMQQAMADENLPLYGLDQMRPISEYDIVGFTLQYELNYTNCLQMLHSGNIPMLAEDRGDDDPLVIAGGEGALAPEPLVIFMDAFVLGDGEDPAMEIMQACAQWKKEGINRAEKLKRLSQIDGVYVPSFYEVEYNDDNTIKAFYRKDSGETKNQDIKIKKRLFNVLEDYGCVKPIVPMVEAVHDRFTIEVKRGCTRGCRFCAAGMITRPIRERTPEQILEIAKMGMDNTGYRDISLLSLSTADYTCLLPTVQLLNANLEKDMVSISLPSLRLNAFDVKLADEISKVRKTGFTFAPEAGSERLRKVISKVVPQEDVFRIIEEVCSKGWRTLKFYFMIGLPTETYADLDGIVELVNEAYRIGRKHHGKRIKLNVGVSPYVPKPHTPFQWEPQLKKEELKCRYDYVAHRLGRMKGVSLKRHDVSGAMIEAVLARGDRRIGKAILRAWELGCKFDGWSEWFRVDLWQQAFEETGINAEFYANRLRDQHEIHPWDHVEVNLGKNFLWKERKLAYKEHDVFDCSTVACVGCNACSPDDGIDHVLVRDIRKSKKGGGKISIALPEPIFMGDDESWLDENKPAVELPKNFKYKYDSIDEDEEDKIISDHARLSDSPAHQLETVQRLRIGYTKKDRQRFIAHRDMIRFLQLIIQRLRLPVSWSKGFHPLPIMQFSPPLSLGFESECEYFDIFLYERHIPSGVLRSMNLIAPPGIEFFEIHDLPVKGPSVEQCIIGGSYKIELDQECSELSEAINRFNTGDEFIAPVRRKSGAVNIDLKMIIEDVSIENNTVNLTLKTFNGSLIGPLYMVNSLSPNTNTENAHCTRTNLQLEQDILVAVN